MSKIINAFHPDYIKTYHPEFLTTIRTESSQHAHGVINGGKSKAKRESVHGKNVDSIDRFPKTQPVNRTMEEKKRKMLAVTDFYTFSRAGMPKGAKP
jgi:hypothetical protein